MSDTENSGECGEFSEEERPTRSERRTSGSSPNCGRISCSAAGGAGESTNDHFGAVALATGRG